MKKIITGLAMIAILSGCNKTETGNNLANAFPEFTPSKNDYLKNLTFADSIEGSFEYNHSSNLIFSSEKNFAVIYLYLKPNLKLNGDEFKKLKNQLKSAESNISNLKVYDELKYILVQNGKEIRNFTIPITK